MIARVMMLCCTLIPIIGLAVAPEKTTRFSTVDLNTAAIRNMSMSGRVSLAGGRLEIGEPYGPVQFGHASDVTSPRAINAACCTGPCPYSDGRFTSEMLNSSDLINGKPVNADYQQLNVPALIVFAIPLNSSGGLVITYKFDDGRMTSPNPVIVPASAKTGSR
jgi:hypothetical protein